MGMIRKQVTVRLDLDQFQLFERAAAQKGVPAGQFLKSFIDWRKVKQIARAERDFGEPADDAA